MKKSIIWLASYPKSGNTWARIFLANYLANTEQPIALNQIHRFGMGDAIARTYNMVNGAEIDLQDQSAILRLRPRVLQGIVANNADVNFVKTHNVNGPAYGHELIPPQVTRSAIYIVRNPLDVTLSFARHFGRTHKETVDALANPDHVTTPDGSNVWQYLGSWSDHVMSWASAKPYPVLVLRYEDMLSDPQTSFGSMLKHIGMPVDDARLEKAIKFASFEESSKQEDERGFNEASPKSERFFSKGKSDQWKEDLAPQLIKNTKRWHRKVMKKFGYLDD
jgi:hypothetical protein